MAIPPAVGPAAMRRRRAVQHLLDLGPPAVGAFLAELGEEGGCSAEIERLLAEYGTVDPRIVRALGGDRYYSPLDLVEP